MNVGDLLLWMFKNILVIINAQPSDMMLAEYQGKLVQPLFVSFSFFF